MKPTDPLLLDVLRAAREQAWLLLQKTLSTDEANALHKAIEQINKDIEAIETANPPTD